ncbi:cupredoxin domain-containing protein [Andreprevotia chitinilytica]|uniref:cupredoxin domain-containing protein n=1 Tax=Andreprevotia chitinilytica TaxID=396808 RepID=UPI00054EFE35|nr:cupredoxin domain-containing protein [Andreprevotia chitinilytica]
MFKLNRRGFLSQVATLSAALAGSVVLEQMAQGATERIIRITAKRFEYMPSVVQIKAGESVILELISADVPMGFNLPDLKLRTDVVPGMVARVTIPPQKPREMVFYCDVFCGSGHEDMSGVLKVVA